MGSATIGDATGDIVGITSTVVLKGIIALEVETPNRGLISSSSSIRAKPKDLRSFSTM